MRPSPRLALRALLILVALALVWYRLVPHHARPHIIPRKDLSVTSPLNQPGGGPAPAEAYTIYSALYQQAANEPLVFAENSQTDIPQVGASCLKPTTPEEHELSDAFSAANSKSHGWQQNFAIPQGYRVLPPMQTAEALACIEAHGHGPASCSAYKGVQHVRFLGVPGLDRASTHALVSVIKSCGPDCGSGGIFEVEKSGDTWQRSPASNFTTDCSWMY